MWAQITQAGRVRLKNYVNMFTHTGVPSSRLEKKQTINSRKRHALCDAVVSYERKRWKFEHVVRNSIGNEIWSINASKYYYLHLKSIEFTHILCVRCSLWRSLPFQACFAITVTPVIAGNLVLTTGLKT